MKIRLLLTILALGVLGGSAKLAACPPAPTPSPAAFLTSTPAPSPTASPSPACSPCVSATPGATPQAPAPAPTPTPSPTPIPPAAVPVAPAETKSLEKSVLQFEQDWTNAVAKHDLNFLDQAEADEYTYTDPAGIVSRKDDDLARAQVGDIEIESFSFKDEKVHLYGETAVVTGEIDIQGTTKGANLTGNYRWTDVFVQHNGAWQVVASQATAIEDNDD